MNSHRIAVSVVIGGDYAPLQAELQKLYLRDLESNGMKIFLTTELNPDVLNWSWAKVHRMKQLLLNDFDWVLSLDADILPGFENGLSRAVESVLNSHRISGNEIFLSQDYNGICMGFWMMKNGERAQETVQAMLDLGQIDNYLEFDTRDTWEQNTFKKLLKSDTRIGEKLELIPESVVANPRSRGLRTLPCCYHFWGNSGVDKLQLRFTEFQKSPEKFLKDWQVLEN